MKVRVVLTPEGGRWNASAPSIRGCRSWGRSLTEVRRRIVDAIATNFEVNGGDGDRVRKDAILEEEVRLSSRATERLELARERRAALGEAERVAMNATASAITALLREGLSVRDIGALLGISGQRVQQLKALSVGGPPAKSHAERVARAVGPHDGSRRRRAC